jgi:membrane protein
MAEKSSMVRNAAAVFKKSFSGFMKDDGLTMSAALAYYSAFSLAPILLIAVAIAGAFFGEDAVRGALDEELRRNMGTASATVIQDMVASASKPANNVLMSIAGTALLLLGAAGFFGQLQGALNRIWDVGTPPVGGIRGFFKKRFMSFSMVLVTGFLLLISMLMTTALQVLSKQLGTSTELPIAAWGLASGVLSFAVIALLFASIFKVLPNAAIRWRDVWVGALFTSALFMIGKSAIGWYLGRQATASTYGSAGSFVLVLAWLYYSSIILLFGAEFTEAHATLKGREFGIRGRPRQPSPAP